MSAPALPAQVQVAVGCSAALGDAMARFGWRRPLLVHGKRSFAASGAADAVLPQLEASSLARWDEVVANPTDVSVAACTAALAAHDADVVVAVGGGSVIDTAKVAVWAHARGGDVVRALDAGAGAAPVAATLPIVAMPTTAGTGSEVTHFAAIYRDGVKSSVADEALRPVLALCDPALTCSQPRATTVASGLDCFCQAVESLWSVGSDEASRAHAAVAARLAWRHLEAAADPSLPMVPALLHRSAMVEAATRAGLAIDTSKTTACHALSYTLTARFGVDHGLAVALFLAPALRYAARVGEADCVDPRGVAAVRRALWVICAAVDAATGAEVDAAAAVLSDDAPSPTLIDAAERAAVRIERWMKALGAPQRLAAVGVTAEADLASIVASVNAERLGNYPRRLDAAALGELVGAVA